MPRARFACRRCLRSFWVAITVVTGIAAPAMAAAAAPSIERLAGSSPVVPGSDVDAMLAATSAAAAPLHAYGRYLTDSTGRVVLLRGVNATGDAKVPNFEPLTSSSQLDPLPGWGINALRLLFTWEAFEPARGSYDQSYLDYYDQVVSWAEDHGLYVLVDFHQDAYSRYNIGGCGEGFPRWAVTSKITPATPDNGPSCSNWGTRMISDLDHHTTWREFHADSEGARTSYLEMVKIVTDRMSGHPNVIGYELINEPWGTDAELYALYEAVGAVIRERDPGRILFEPPHALTSSGLFGNNIPRLSFDSIVHSPHFYDPWVFAFGSWLGESPADYLDPMLDKAESWGVPMVLGEYGVSASVSNGADYLEAVHAWLDGNFVSSFQWSWTPGWTQAGRDGWNGEDFSIVDDKGVRPNIFKPRPSPQETAGVPQSFSRTSSGFTYSWTHAPSLGNTEIFLPSGYAQSKTIAYSGSAVTIRCQISGQKMTCSGSQAGKASVTMR